MKQFNFKEKVWIPSINPFLFQERIDPKTGKKTYIIQGLMLPFDKISRNNVMYNKKSIEQKHKDLVGRPMMYNHQIEGHSLPIGHFIDSWIESDGWHYKADIDPEESDILRKLERGDLRHVSIQLVGDKVVERMNENHDRYTEAYIGDVIEGSIVPAPGFLDTSAKFSEAFKNTEDITTTTGSGAISVKLLKKEGKLMIDVQENPEGNYPQDLSEITKDIEKLLQSKGFKVEVKEIKQENYIDLLREMEALITEL